MCTKNYKGKQLYIMHNIKMCTYAIYDIMSSRSNKRKIKNNNLTLWCSSYLLNIKMYLKNYNCG